MRFGTVWQRHLKSCPRDERGELLPHRCRGSWGYVLDLPRGADGRRRQITKSGFPSRAAAKQALQEMADLVVDFPVHSLTVGEYLDSWLETKRSLKPSTGAHYADAIRLYLKPNLGHIQLRELRPDHLDRMYSAIARGQRNKPLNPASLRRVHACLRSALNTAVKRRLIANNPANYIELPPENPRRPIPWTAEQCQTFLDATKDDSLWPLYRLLLVTGMRRGEVVGLRWLDVDLDRGGLVVAQQVTQVRGRAVIGTPKTRRGARRIPLDPTTVALLVEHRCRQQAERAADGVEWTTNGYVFSRPDGSALRPEFVSRHFQTLVRQCGLPSLRLHDLRHTNASLALEAGIDVKIVSERLGHATTAITNDIYTHVSTTVGRAAAARLASVLESEDRQADAAPADVSEMLAPAKIKRPGATSP